MYGLLGRTPTGEFVLAPHAQTATPGEGAYWAVIGPPVIHDRTSETYRPIGEPMGSDMFSNGRTARAPRFGRRSVAAYHGGLLHVTDGGRYAIRAYRDSDVPDRIIRVAIEPRPTPAALMRADAAERMPLENLPPELRGQVLDIPTRPTIPWIADLKTDPLGLLWVGEHPFPGDSVQTWTVLDREGRVQGQARIPIDVQVQAIGASRLAGIWRDELDVQHVVVYEVRRSPR